MTDRRRAEQSGRRAEWFALLMLRLKGFRLLEARFRCPQGEIDLIVRRGRTVAFVEVKRRSEAATAAAAISPQQQRRIVAAAQVFLQRNPDLATGDQRFDAVLVAPGRWPVHMPNAFRSDG